MKIGFGKYKGQELEDLPTSYLEWLVEEIQPMGPRAKLVEEAINQLKMREGMGVPRGKVSGR